MKPIFEPSDFDSWEAFPPQMSAKAVMARIANAKLEKIMAKWPIGYATIKETDNEIIVTSLCPTKHSDATHTARLAFIEPIKRECAKHEPEDGWFMLSRPYVKCKHCNAELEATWKVKGET